MRMKDIAVVGAGVAGLSLAYEILQRDPGASVAVYEATGRPGGNIRTDHADGYTVEWGPNGFLDNVPETLDLVGRLGLSPRLQPASEAAKRRFIWRAGRLHEVKANPLAFLRSPLLSPAGKLRLLAEPFSDTRPGVDESVFDFAARHMGAEAARVLVDAMVSGVFAGNSKELSLKSAFPKMHEMESAHGSLVRAMLARMRDRQSGRLAGPSGGPSGPAGHLTSFLGGMEELIDALVDVLGPDRVTCDSPVSWIAHDGPKRLRLRFGDGEERSASAVVIATPAWNAGPLIDGIASQAADTLREIPGAPIAVVALGFRRSEFEHSLDGFGFLVPRGEGLSILGSLWTSSVFPGRADEDHVLLRTMVGGAHEPDALALSDAKLVELARNDMALAMGVRAEPAFRRVYRSPKGIPQYVSGHEQRVAVVEDACRSLPGLYVAGNSYRGIAVNSCIRDAGPLADRILGEAS